MNLERLVKLVPHGLIKTVLVAFLALVLGTSHAVCACLSQNVNAAHADGHDMYAAHTETEHQSHTVSSGHLDHSGKSTPCMSGESGCDHCASSEVYKASSKLGAIAWSGFEPLAKTIVPDAVEAKTRDGSRTTKRVAFLWRGPPIATPVSQKIRLLN